ncbi:glutamine synthetase family protein [Saccharicrinis sp. FJH54]|uniref:glutamine synthetase family protein n=1 Tax=Saccharicrinis sp. FJH54 TaxID=3344665 RepID=UPI0035D4EF19
MHKEEIIQFLKDSNESKVKIAVADIDGILRGKYIHKHKFLDTLDKTLGLCDVIFGWDSGDVCYDNTEVTGWHSGYPDAKAVLDVSTFRRIPWENGTPFFLADFSEDKKYAESTCPRSLLKKINADCESMGFKARFSQEFEWFNFKGKPGDMSSNEFHVPEPVTPGMFGYSLLRTSLNQSYCNDLFEMLEAFNIPLEGIHTETGPGVYEAAIIYDDILPAADKAILFKTAVKEIAYRHNMTATFMAKWNIKLPGSGGHIHQSLWDNYGGKNLFAFDKGSDKMSEILEYYIAGQLTCLPDILPMFAPTINSYKRIGHGDWAPSTVTWGMDNRTAAIRVIRVNDKNTRIESRVPGADTNAYLAFAAALASGLYGIKHKLKLDIPPSDGNAYQDKKRVKLPDNLLDATVQMAASPIAKELFGEAFVNHFTKTRIWEWRQFMNQVTDWELKRYFEII